MVDLKIDSLFKSYDKKLPPVVRDVSLGVKGGQLISLLGPSGCGKTTILRMIAGLLFPDSGSISIKGENISKKPPYQRNIGMVFQNYALFPHMTIFENVAFGLKMKKTKISRTEMKEKVEEVLKMVDLEGYGERYPKNLSGGQQQRVALARALVLRPSVLLLDEPLSALDAKLRRETREEIRKLQLELGVATVFVTHDQEEALAISDKIAILNHGVIQQFDEPKNIYESPVNEFVARFMGIPNIFPISSYDNGVYITHNGMKVSSSKEENEISSVGIRPDRIEVEKGNDREGINHFAGILETSSYNGTMIEMKILLHSGVNIFATIPSSHPSAYIEIGQEVTVFWNREDTLLLLPEIK